MSNQMEPQTILLGGWPFFSEAAGLNEKEEPETFDWMNKRQEEAYYEDMRQALDKVPGCREYLRSLNPTDRHNDPLVNSLYDALADGPNHSGASFGCLVGSYRHALWDWDGFVLAQKEHIIMGYYKARQIQPDKLRWFLNDTYHTFGMTEAETIVKNMADHNVEFSDESVPTSWADLKAITNPLMTEFRLQKEAEEAKAAERRFKNRIERLEFNLKHPSRWFWPRGEGNPRYCITEQEMAAMEAKHPGYGAHIKKVCQELDLAGGPIRDPWSAAAADALEAKLIAKGLMGVCV